jgi:hypothetical protein
MGRKLAHDARRGASVIHLGDGFRGFARRFPQPQHSGGRFASQDSTSFTRHLRSKHRLAQLSTFMPQASLAEKS